MRGVYEVSELFSALSTAKNLVLTLPADVCGEILGATITNADRETNEQLQAGIYRSTSAGTGASTAPAIKKKEQGDRAAYGVVTHSYVTTEPTFEDDGYNYRGFSSLVGYIIEPYNWRTVFIPPSGRFALRLLNPIFTVFECIMTLEWREIG